MDGLEKYQVFFRDITREDDIPGRWSAFYMADSFSMAERMALVTLKDDVHQEIFKITKD